MARSADSLVRSSAGAPASTPSQPNYKLRRQRVFLVLAGIFLGTLSLLNLLGITRFLDLSFPLFGMQVPMVVAVGVLPYPITFLCTDLISEIYGRKRATEVVWMGLALNVWVVLLLWLGGVLPGVEGAEVVDPETGMVLNADGTPAVFFQVRDFAFATVAASMIAYLSAQWCDVQLFHLWKWLTGGRHLWLRNNGSTMVSQLVDTTAVILIAHFWAGALPNIADGEPLLPQLLVLIASGYVFKVTVALVDTGPVYLLVGWLRPFLGIDKDQELGPGDEPVALSGRGQAADRP